MLVALLAGALTLAAACTQDPEPTASDERADRLARPGMHAVDPPPLSERHDEVRVAAGDRLLIWGGQSAESSMTGTTFGDGAVLDVTTGRWSEVSESPFPHGLFSATGVFDGEEFVIVGTECDERIPAPTTGQLPVCTGPAAAAWDPSEDSWRRLPAPPLDTDRFGVPRLIAASPAVGSDGTAVFVDRLDGAAITWDRDGDRWGTVESPPGAWSWSCADPTVPWVVAGSDDLADPLAGVSFSVLRPGETAWSTPVRSEAHMGSVASCAGGHVIVSRWDGRLSSGAVIDPLTGEYRSAFDADPAVIGQAAGIGAWTFVQLGPQPRSVEGSTEDTGDESSLMVQLVSDGPTVPAGTRSSLYTLTGPSATYVGRGIVVCEMAHPDECRMWVPPPEATPE